MAIVAAPSVGDEWSTPLPGPPHEGSFVVEAILGHARSRSQYLDVGEVRRELSNLRHQLTNQHIELLGPRLGERVIFFGHVHLPASGGGTKLANCAVLLRGES